MHIPAGQQQAEHSTVPGQRPALVQPGQQGEGLPLQQHHTEAERKVLVLP